MPLIQDTIAVNVKEDGVVLIATSEDVPDLFVMDENVEKLRVAVAAELVALQDDLGHNVRVEPVERHLTRQMHFHQRLVR